MEQLLIKLSETHYIIVDNSEIKKGDYHVATRIIKSNGVNAIAYTDKEQLEAIAEIGGAKKITHSTQPLEIITALPDTGQGEVTEFGYNKIKPLSLSEVEEAINGYNVQTMADEATNEVREENADYIFKDVYKEFYKDGFNAHKELVKDRLFTKKQMEMLFAYAHSVGMNTILQIQSPHLLPKQDSDKLRDELIQSFLPPTEWNIEFENGKLKLAWTH